MHSVITSTVIPWVGRLLAIRVACGVPRLYLFLSYAFPFCYFCLSWRFPFLSFRFLSVLAVVCVFTVLYHCISSGLFSVFRPRSCSCIVLWCFVSYFFSVSVLVLCRTPLVPFVVSPFFFRWSCVFLSVCCVRALLFLHFRVLLCAYFSVRRLLVSVLEKWS